MASNPQQPLTLEGGFTFTTKAKDANERLWRLRIEGNRLIIEALLGNLIPCDSITIERFGQALLLEPKEFEGGLIGELFEAFKAPIGCRRILDRNAVDPAGVPPMLVHSLDAREALTRGTTIKDFQAYGRSTIGGAEIVWHEDLDRFARVQS